LRAVIDSIWAPPLVAREIAPQMAPQRTRPQTQKAA
jgi:hypothetical protein